MLSILLKPEATSSPAGEVTHLAEFPWRLLSSMVSELVRYKHLVLSERVITFVTITQLGFLQLFVIYIEVRSQSILFGAYILASVTYLLSLRQTLLYGSCAGAFSMYPF